MKFRAVAIGASGLFLAVAFNNCSKPGFQSGGTDQSSQASRTCYPGAGVTGSPKTIEEVVDLINTLPNPVTLPCFLESLDRPLDIYSSMSGASAQPANGIENPRIFIFKNNLILTIATSGPGQSLLEMSFRTAADSSQKGELQFPITGEILRSFPFTRIRLGSYATSCGVCHGGESAGTNFGLNLESFVSRSIQPSPIFRVPFEQVKSTALSCDPTMDAERCRIFLGLFGYGPVRGREFPADMPL